jgi:drug/metabolite transporter (DMT)-like permease
MASLVFALTSAIAYGVSDFLGGLASRRVAALQVVLISYPVSAIVIASLAPFVGGHADAGSLAWGAASGAVMAIAMWCFYVALAEGPMSVVSPVTAVMVAAVPVLVGLGLGERPTLLSCVGIALAVAAIVLVSRETVSGEAGRRFTPRVARLTLVAGACFALSFVFTDRVSDGSGLWPLVAARVVASLLVVIAALRSGGSAGMDRRLLVLAVAIGLLDVVANVGMLYAFRNGMLSIVSVLIALYPAVTVGLAVAVLRERLGTGQWAGMALATGAVLLIAVAG